MLPFFFEIEMSFGKKRALKKRKRKDSLPQRTFRRAKPMLLHFKNYGFTVQKLWFYTSKTMFSPSKSIGFTRKYLISPVKKKTRYHYNLLLTKKLWKALQNSRISRPIDRPYTTSPI